jgi:hypothetical protein
MTSWMRWVVVAMVVLGGARVEAQAGQAFSVGSIDFFGGQGMDTAALMAKLPVKVGQALTFEQADGVKAGVEAAVLAGTGKAATDVNFVCCDEPGKLQIYVGVQGGSYRAPVYGAAPTGDATLPGEGLGLYQEDMKATAAAVESGHAREDDSKGYALTDDPAAKAVELRMRAYALQHTAAIEAVLRGSKDAAQRQAAAMLLGYAERSPEQVKELARAAGDVDADVRNNAVRALAVMASAGPMEGLEVEPLVAMLSSGSWSDRNKASLLLYRITKSRDAGMLKVLREEAMGALLDGAAWQSAGHAVPFLVMLGRIGGLEEVEIQRLLDAGDPGAIVAAAERK